MRTLQGVIKCSTKIVHEGELEGKMDLSILGSAINALQNIVVVP